MWFFLVPQNEQQDEKSLTSCTFQYYDDAAGVQDKFVYFIIYNNHNFNNMYKYVTYNKIIIKRYGIRSLYGNILLAFLVAILMIVIRSCTIFNYKIISFKLLLLKTGSPTLNYLLFYRNLVHSIRWCR